MAAAVRAKNHGKPHANIIGWLTAYEVATPGVETLDNTTVRLDGDSQPQPDALLRIETGGQSSISEDDYCVFGLAICFLKQEGELEKVAVLEPIPSAALEK